MPSSEGEDEAGHPQEGGSEGREPGQVGHLGEEETGGGVIGHMATINIPYPIAPCEVTGHQNLPVNDIRFLSLASSTMHFPLTSGDSPLANMSFSCVRGTR
uniref:Uncharacterized protein n=1 Tax=Anguilla anguilla TaxID=7936 RepID=A0A0E9QQT3_ANGAN